MFDPYSSRGTRPIKKEITVGNELKRLFGGVFRFPLAVFLVVAPLLLALCGGVDLLVTWLYAVSHKGLSDTRSAVFWIDCLADQSKKLCKGLYFGSVSGNVKIRLWPFQQPLEPPYLYFVLIGFAWISFLSIGNPRLKPLGNLLIQVFYLNFRKKGENEEKHNRLIPWRNSKEPDEKSWVIGGVVTRLWSSDPGYFSFVRQEKYLPEPYLLSSKILQTNLTIVAPPGQGKTGSIFQPLVVYSRRIKGAAIFFDSKGNDFNPDYFDYNFDLNNPASSIKINLFSGATPAQAGERLSEALIPELSDDKQYFSNNAKDAMATLVAAHHASFNRLPELAQLQHYLTYSSQLERLIQKVLDNLKEDRQQEGLLLAAGIRRIIKLMENKNDILGSLATAISPFLTEPVSSLLVANPGNSSYTIEELLKNPGLVRLGLPVADNPRIAPMIGRLVLAQFTFAVLSPGCNTRIFKLAAVDEAHNFVTPSIAKGMAHARSNNAGYALAVQTLSQIEEKGKPLLNTIFAASGTKIVMAGVGDEDAERFSRTFGEVELPYVTHSQNRSQSSGHSSSANRHRGHELEFFPGGSGSEHRSSLGQSRTNMSNRMLGEGSNEQLHLRRLFLPSEIRSLPLRHAIIESSDAFGHRWPAQVINMDRELIKELEKQLDGKKSRRSEKTVSKDLVSTEDVFEETILKNDELPFSHPTFTTDSSEMESGSSSQKADELSLPVGQTLEVKDPENDSKTNQQEQIIQVAIEKDNPTGPELHVQEKTSEWEENSKSDENPAEKDPLEEIMFGQYEGEV
jgi:hypothetical protein